MSRLLPKVKCHVCGKQVALTANGMYPHRLPGGALCSGTGREPVETPELDRQLQIVDGGEPDIISDFYDWLVNDNGGRVVLAKWEEYMVHADGTVHERVEPILVQDIRSPEQLLAEYFGIDLKKIEEERRAILADLRERHE